MLGLHVHLDIAAHGNNYGKYTIELKTNKWCELVVLHCNVAFEVVLKTWGSPFSKRHRQISANGVRMSQESSLEVGRRAPFVRLHVKASEAPSQLRCSKPRTQEDEVSDQLLDRYLQVALGEVE